MLPKKPANGSGNEPRYITQQRQWGAGVVASLRERQNLSQTGGPGGQLNQKTVDWEHALSFRAEFEHKAEYSGTLPDAFPLVVAAGHVVTPQNIVTVATGDIALPGSGNLYVYITVTVVGTPTAVLTSSASIPAYWSAYNKINVILGYMTETETGYWDWVAWHEGDIFIEKQNQYDLFPVDTTKTSGAAGDATTQCAFVYTVKTLGADTLLTGAAPIWNRPQYGKMVAATSGTAYLNSSGTVVLYQVDEVFDVAAC